MNARHLSLVALVATTLSCGGGDTSTPSETPSDVGVDDTAQGGGDSSLDAAVDVADDSLSPPDTRPPGDGAVPPPPPKTDCALPFAAEDTTKSTVVGTGTAASCTQDALVKAVASGGAITFDCGGPATIAITSQIELPRGKDVTIDGRNAITLDGGGKTRILHFDGGDFRKTHTKITLQHLTLKNGHAIGTKTFAPAPAPCSQGFKDGSGGAILVNDGVLHVLDSTFIDNRAATPGPDVGGGAIYASGSIEVTVLGSKFSGNSGANGGAIGSLFSNLTLMQSVLETNAANGTGANYIDASCPDVGGQHEAGSGGNGGAVVIDGGEDFAVVLCGDVFHGNTGGALGGGIFRTPDIGRQITTIDQTTFDANSAKGGGAMYFHHSDLTITASAISNNSAEGSGALQADDTNLTLTNDTFAGNAATKSLGGAIALFGNGGTIRNCTFANNHADGGSGIFGAALAGGSTFTIDNTIFWNQTTKDAGSPMTCQSESKGSGDLQWPATHVVGGAPDSMCVAGIAFADAMLSALGDNGGPTATMMPKAGSPAIGLGAACPKLDQRGKPRPADKCTAGAVEVP